LSTKALSSLERGVQAVLRVERKAIRKGLKVIEQGALDATTIDNDGIPVSPDAEPLAGKRLRVALDMRKSRRDSPVYIDVLTRRIEGAEKADALANVGAPRALNIGVVNIVVPQRQYETIDVTASPTEKK
jgi:hypothetical protein